MTDPRRLAALRAELARRGWDGFLVPRADEHQGEYVPPRAERLAWLTGFGGSAGMAAVLAAKAAIFVDGRYTLQVRDQVAVDLFAPRHLTEEPPGAWLAENLTAGQKLAYDPWLHTPDQVRRLKTATAKAGAELIAADENPLDAVWADQPAPPRAPIHAQPLSFAGRTSADKRAEIAGALKAGGAEAVILTLPDSIAWLFNLRGGDVERAPLPLSFAILEADGRASWFVDPAKLPADDSLGLDPEVTPLAPAELPAALDALLGRPVLIDPASAPDWIAQRLRDAGAELMGAADPCQLPKARKNPTELEGIRAAHRRDGVALSRFLASLDRELADPARNEAPSELELSDRLRGFREDVTHFRDLSFDAIAGSGPNGAIVHYRVTPESDRRLGEGELFLLDSGGQYLDGTTDVTRTLAIGAPSDEMCRNFTLVLKGHIALARARFPKGTTGSQLDSLARYPLWLEGLDYDHGTGHGVGAYLSVHEGPQRISKLPNAVALEPGMVVSNEPGYYKTGAYGIRIENLVAVVEAPAGPDGRETLAFETLTLAPIDLNLVEVAILSEAERAWLNAYHARVRETHLGQLDREDAAWLEQATRAV